ncbi:hypothetical protein BD847_4181 [Flavobacterium cutihirudinis]|uniref:MepB protein n=1 Tax=Flavobacterium cutihirudinis TaxID=1265740 RepID=A0A3D9FJB2_9FLAO|nr:MepB family protein [Flavobacterium cutihirudinis]RED18930.1 hypothetical protein BD847_4181 [Flavobacterium cutihirudinis]
MTSKKNENKETSLSKNLILAKELVYEPCEFDCTDFQSESESAEYDAFDFKIDGKQVKYRSAKITPTKTGQFVTLWKRKPKGTIEPFHDSDIIDFVIISVRKEDFLGQFIFPKAVLLEKGIFSTEKKEGIRATRVYPPWDETTSKQAQKTQKWQLDYFYSINPKKDLEQFKKLIR